MKALRHDRYGPPDVLQWTEIEKPQPRAREVLVKVAAAAINPKDALVRKGKMKLFTGNRLPRGSGYDFSGTIESVGANAALFKPGDEVFGMLNRWDAGACAEYVAVPVGELARKPGNISLEDSAAIALVGQTSIQALRDLGKLKPGLRVLINGASGGVGVHAVQIANILGGEVTAVTSSRNSELVHELGADVVVDYANTELLRYSHSFDIFYDVFGNYSFSEVKPLLSPRGRYITTVPSAANLRDHFRSRLLPGRQARMVVVKSNTRDLNLLKDWIEDKQLRVIIDRRYPMPEAAAAHQYLETKRAQGKVLLTI